MIPLGVMSFVEDEHVDLVDRDERVHETLIENIGRADDDHVLAEISVPYILAPQIASHVTTETFDLLVQVTLEHGILLEYQRDAVDLSLVSGLPTISRFGSYQEECNSRRPAKPTMLQLLIENISQQENRYQGFPGT